MQVCSVLMKWYSWIVTNYLKIPKPFESCNILQHLIHLLVKGLITYLPFCKVPNWILFIFMHDVHKATYTSHPSSARIFATGSLTFPVVFDWSAQHGCWQNVCKDKPRDTHSRDGIFCIVTIKWFAPPTGNFPKDTIEYVDMVYSKGDSSWLVWWSHAVTFRGNELQRNWCI